MITVNTLVARKACSDQVTLFQEFLRDREGVEPTPDVVKEAAQYGLDVRWAQYRGLITIPDGLLVFKDGTREWYLNGLRHREDGPAIEGVDGRKEWFLYGKRHREDGPAFEGSDGTREWWIHGLFY